MVPRRREFLELSQQINKFAIQGVELQFEAIDAGPLAMSRNIEPLAVLWIRLAYAQKLGTDFGFSLLRR